MELGCEVESHPCCPLAAWFQHYYFINYLLSLLLLSLGIYYPMLKLEKFKSRCVEGSVKNWNQQAPELFSVFNVGRTDSLINIIATL